MESFIRIIRYPYEEPYNVRLVVIASNGKQQGELEIYCNASDLTVFADSLQDFLNQKSSFVLWELGSEQPEDRFAFYFRIHISEVTANGQCAIEVCFCNNLERPDHEKSEFSIKTLPADLDRLSRLFKRFSRLEDQVLEWSTVIE